MSKANILPLGLRSARPRTHSGVPASPIKLKDGKNGMHIKTTSKLPALPFILRASLFGGRALSFIVETRPPSVPFSSVLLCLPHASELPLMIPGNVGTNQHQWLRKRPSCFDPSTCCREKDRRALDLVSRVTGIGVQRQHDGSDPKV